MDIEVAGMLLYAKTNANINPDNTYQMSGNEISAKTLDCNPNSNGLVVRFRPSKILGKNTRIVWKMIRDELINIQFNNEKKIKINSTFIDKSGKIVNETYKVQPFENIISYKNYL